MKLKRREFLKGVAGSALLASALPDTALGRNALPQEAMGILYDATLCVGCQACMSACKESNLLPDEHTGPKALWDNPVDLSSKTLNIIKKYEQGTRHLKDREFDGYAFVKKQCMHCLKPACTSACPASALKKDPISGIVTYNSDACIGCRYCQVACPFNVPKFEWDNPFPKIVKCQLCKHLLDMGGISACCSSCPTGASLFGPVDGLLNEAKVRLSMTPGKFYDYPTEYLNSGKNQTHMAKPYIHKVFGETEIGGTQVMLLSGVPFNKIGFPNLPDESYAVLSESIQHTLYNKMILPVMLLGGLSLLIGSRKKRDEISSDEDS